MAKPHYKKMMFDLLAIVRGINEVLTQGKTMPFRQGTIDGPGLLAVVVPLLGTLQAVGDQKAAWKASIVTRDAKGPTISALIDDIKKGASLGWGDSSVEFGQFGFAPKKKPAPLTPEQKQTKLERYRATKAARGTLGRRQRQAIKGVVPTPPSTPNASPGGTAPK
ncbi:MAG TPA: hypothetical protein VFF73_19315 [Planctomycetota bacterium]|nr:hypothetical protein [Planctomycetota bacterium]